MIGHHHWKGNKKTELKPGMIFNDWSRMFYNIFIQKAYLLWNRSGAKTRARASKLVGVQISPYLSVPYCGGRFLLEQFLLLHTRKYTFSQNTDDLTVNKK